MTRVLILGATGWVGQQLLDQALEHDQVSSVIAPTRKALSAHPKLNNPIVNYEQLPEQASWWACDVVLCALGSTLKQAGSRAAFYRVDHDYVLMAAKLAKANGCHCLVLNSSLGAKPDAGSFYLRVKGETEGDLIKLGLRSLTLVRPSLLDGDKRPEQRHAEAMSIALGKLLGPLIPKKFRPISTAKVARAMLNAGLVEVNHVTSDSTRANTIIIESDALH